MSTTTGYNPMRWACETDGCFNIRKRPKIEIFADCLPGKIAFGDIDSIVEINGRILILEFKEGEPRDLKTGQRLLFQRLTQISSKIWVVLVCANSETMVVNAIATVHSGKISNWQTCSTDGLRSRIRSWADRASRALPTYLARAA